MKNNKWVLGEVHPDYGEVQMMARLTGEDYRFFIKDNVVSMIPLSMLQDEKPCSPTQYATKDKVTTY